MQTQISIEIARPIDEVFVKANDVTKWSVTCVEEEILEGDGGTGTRFHMVTQDRGRRMDFEGVVTRYEPPHASRVELVGESFDLDVLYEFEDLGGSTRVTQSSSVRGKGLWKVMLALTGWMVKRSSCDAQQNELEGLRTYCEG